MKKTPRDRIAHAVQMYKSNLYANEALGISRGCFLRLCKEYGIPTPYERRYGKRGSKSIA